MTKPRPQERQRQYRHCGDWKRIEPTTAATRDSIADYLEARASKLRGHAERGDSGWALARHDAVLIDALASDVRNELDVEAGHG